MMSAQPPDRRFRQLQALYDQLTARIAASDKDVGRALSALEIQIHKEHLAELTLDRQTVLEYLVAFESNQPLPDSWPPDIRSSIKPPWAGEKQLYPLIAPPPPDTFAGRTSELKELAQILLQDGDVAITAATAGMGGVGKTTVARHVARDLLEHFPAGVLWVNVGPSATAEALLMQLALELDLDLTNEHRIENRAHLVRADLVRRGRVMVVLDDLWDVDLGRWFMNFVLPANRALLVTSRDVRLSRALCSHVQRLDVLSEREALDLLENFLGSLVSFESTAKRIIALLGGLPLALEICARLCDEGATDLPWLLAKLETLPRLGILKLVGQEQRETSVEASLALSFEHLEPDLQRRFCALGVFASSPFDLAALAAVWDDEDLGDAERAARSLLHRALIARTGTKLGHHRHLEAAPQGTGERVEDHPLGSLGGSTGLNDQPSTTSSNEIYTQHSLLRDYALSLLKNTQEYAEKAANHAAYFQALPGRNAEDWQAVEYYWDQIEHAWRETQQNRSHLMIKFYYEIERFLETRCRWDTAKRWISATLELPESILTASDRSRLLNDMGYISINLGQRAQAIDYFQQALPISRAGGDRGSEGVILNNVGMLYSALGEKTQALDHYQQALPIMREVGHREYEANVLNNIGLACSDLGDKAQALDYYQQALPIMKELGHRVNEARVLSNIGQVHADLRDDTRALEHFQQALLISREVGDRLNEGRVLNRIGMVYSIDDKAQALDYYEKALRLSRDVVDPFNEVRVLSNIGQVHADLRDDTRALEQFQQALLFSREVGDRLNEGRVLHRIGMVYSSDDKAQALDYYKEALDISLTVGDRWGERDTRYEMARTFEAMSRWDKAEEQLLQVVALDRTIGHPSLEIGRTQLLRVQSLRQHEASE